MKNLITVFIIAALFIGLNYAGLAQQPDPKPPTNVAANTVKTDDGYLAVELTWKLNDEGDTPDYFYIYIAHRKTEDLNKFQKYQKVPYRENSKELQYVIRQLKSGDYSFYISSVIFQNGQAFESDPSDIVHVTLDQPPQEEYVKIISTPNYQGYVGKEYVYQLKTKSNVRCPVLYKLIDVPEGMKIDESGKITWTPKQEGSYSVTVKAYLDCAKDIHDIQTYKIRVSEGNDNKGWVKIKSKPKTYGHVGEPYSYQLMAESNVKCPILFKLIHGTDGMEIDKNRGLLKWVPQKPGKYEIAVKAYLECHPDIHTVQKWVVEVKGEHPPDPCAVISGTITDPDGNPVPEGIVTAWSLKDKVPPIRTEFRQGHFALNVPEGVYAVQFEAPGFVTEFYDDVRSIQGAAQLDVKCEHDYSLKAELEKIPEHEFFKVSGHVTDESGDPVWAMIYMMPMHWNQGRSDNERYKKVFVGTTDENGFYEVEVPGSHTYIALAKPKMNSGYLHQFYKGKDNQMEADLIPVEGDVEGINFKLKEEMHYDNGFSGIIETVGGNRLEAIVILNLIKAADGSEIKFTRTVETDAQGTFTFKNLIPGDYVMLSIPKNRDFIPGYYRNNGLVVQNWQDATQIGVGETVMNDLFKCQHQAYEDRFGPAQLKGKIVAENDYIKSGSDNPLSTNSVPGVFVYITDENDNIVDYAFTDRNGDFSINQIEAGIYTLHTDKVGYTPSSRVVETDYKEKASVDVNITITPDQATSVDEQVAESGVSVYPSPANLFTNIEFDGKTGKANISVVNSLGTKVMTKMVAVDKGFNRISISTVDLSQGVYYVKIINEGKVYSTKFTVMK